METETICRVEKGGSLFIENGFKEVIVQIFFSNGALYKQFEFNNDNRPMPLPAKGIYLVVIQTVNRTFVHKIKWE